MSDARDDLPNQMKLVNVPDGKHAYDGGEANIYKTEYDGKPVARRVIRPKSFDAQGRKVRKRSGILSDVLIILSQGHTTRDPSTSPTQAPKHPKVPWRVSKGLDPVNNLTMGGEWHEKCYCVELFGQTSGSIDHNCV